MTAASMYAAELGDHIAATYANRSALEAIIDEIGSTDATQPARNALNCALAEIAMGNLLDPMRSCDEAPFACIKRIIREAVQADAQFHIRELDEDEFAELEQATIGEQRSETARDDLVEYVERAA